ncbi:MAG: lysozyme inhibitor LprI family protein [Deltaproteobacteria bacterium]|jgi:uncharacterized protein YecT (DUF1311 family)|nr:lysozyme inhibitor LprI family protein [Deltaproteobacteria bacterium]
MHKILFLCILIILATSTQLYSQSVTFSPSFNECLDSGGVREREGCFLAELEWQDKRLNQLYQQVMAVEPNKEALKSAQRAWIVFKQKWEVFLADLALDDFVIRETAYQTRVMITAQQADNLQQLLDMHEYIRNNY